MRVLLASGIIELGPSDNIALDQPRVAMELAEDVNPDPNVEKWKSVGPGIFNTFLLDTGANSVLAMAMAVDDMEGPPIPYTTEGKFVEIGVAGDHEMDISAAYRFDFAGSDGVRQTIFDARILSDSHNDFSQFGPWGLVGMPAMVDRVTTLDMTGWSGGGTGLDDLYMKTGFSNDLPSEPLPPGESHRYAVFLDNRISFDPNDQVVACAPVDTGCSEEPPVWGDVPFLTAAPKYRGDMQEGNFLLDTGAQMSIISPDLGLDIGLDSNGDGVLDDQDDAFVTMQAVGGVGGQISVPVFAIDEVHIPAKQVATGDDVELVWTDLQWLVLDILPGNQPSLDGIFGSDLLTSGWFHAFFYPGQPDGFIDRAHFDFRQMAQQGEGTLYLDLNELVDNVIEPGPGVRLRESARSTDVAEGGATDTYDVVLTGAPTENVTVALGNTDGQVNAFNDAVPSNQLVFTPTNWDTPQVVRAAAADDDVAEGPHTGVITHTVTSNDGTYNNMTVPDITVKITDNDLNLITITEDQAGLNAVTSIDVAEGGTTTYWVKLSQSPPDLDAGSDSGSSHTDNITADNTPTFAGTAEAGSTITLISSVAGTIGTATATGGNWTITASTLADGPHNITATSTDSLGNVSPASSALPVTIDTTAPAAPSVALTSDTGSSNSDKITSDGSLTLSGDELGATVEYSTDGGSNWSGSFTAAEGASSVQVRQTDTAGNVSPASVAFTFTLDTTAPAAPTGLDLDAGSDSGSSSTDDITNDNTPTIGGGAASGATVELTSFRTGRTASRPRRPTRRVTRVLPRRRS